MKEDYTMAVKKAIVEFVLKDPSIPTPLYDYIMTPERIEISQMSGSLRDNFHETQKTLQRNLHSVNPCLAETVNLWSRRLMLV